MTCQHANSLTTLLPLTLRHTTHKVISSTKSQFDTFTEVRLFAHVVTIASGLFLSVNEQCTVTGGADTKNCPVICQLPGLAEPITYLHYSVSE